MHHQTCAVALVRLGGMSDKLHIVTEDGRQLHPLGGQFLRRRAAAPSFGRCPSCMDPRQVAPPLRLRGREARVVGVGMDSGCELGCRRSGVSRSSTLPGRPPAVGAAEGDGTGATGRGGGGSGLVMRVVHGMAHGARLAARKVVAPERPRRARTAKHHAIRSCVAGETPVLRTLAPQAQGKLRPLVLRGEQGRRMSQRFRMAPGLLRALSVAPPVATPGSADARIVRGDHLADPGVDCVKCRIGLQQSEVGICEIHHHTIDRFE